MMKFTTNKILIKESGVKMRNQKNKELIEKNNIWKIII
jgi:hypothetical protein